MRAGAEGQARVEAHDDAPPDRVGGWLVVGTTHSRRPKRIGVEILQPLALPDAIGERSDANAAAGTSSARGQDHDRPPAWRLSAANSACSTVCGHSRTSPGAGSRMASSHCVGQRHRQRAGVEAGLLGALGVEPFQVDAAAPDRPDTGPGAVSQVLARRLFQPEPPLQVVDVEAALAEGRVVEDLLVQRGVGLDALDHQLGQRVLMRAMAVSRVSPWAISLPIIES